MSQFQIFSDGSCDLPPEALSEYHIKSVPFYVSLDQQQYFKEIEELSLKEFYDTVVNQGIMPKTSLPSVQDYVNAFTPDLEDGKDILCFTITTTLSGSFQSANSAKLILEEKYPEAKIFIINTWLATICQGLLVMEASKMQRAGLSAEEAYHTCEELKKSGRIFFFVGSLEFLEKGGRIGKLSSLAGSLLKIIPLIILEGGEIRSGGVCRSKKKAIEKLANITQDHLSKTGEKLKNYIFSIGACTNFDEARQLQACLEKFLDKDYFSPYPILNIGATIGAHTGPDTVGICILKRFQPE